MERAARPHLPLTVENQLGRRRRRQLLTLHNGTSGLSAAQCETRFSESVSLNNLEVSFCWSDKPEEERREVAVGFAIKNYIVTKLIIYY